VETAFGDTASAIPTSKPALAWKVVETVWDSTASEKLWWADVDVSGNGQNMIACSSYGRVYKTADGADTWLETQPTGDNDTFWYKVAVSGNGQVMMAAELEDFLYKSDDGGTTWSEVQPAGEEWDCTALSLSDDGTALLAGLGNERLYLSIDSGENWNEVLPGGDNDFYWSSTGISDDGNTMIAAADNGRIYLSFNRGADWIETRPMGDNDLNWYAVAVSGDGQTMMAALQYGRIYKSVDAGNTWNEIQPADNNDYDWSGVSVSFDGQIMYACNANNNHIYESADGGNTWTELMAGRDWVSVAVSSDGSTALAAATEDYLYKGKLIVFDSISETTAHATAKIVSTNGADATNRGVIYYPYTNTDKSIGDAGVTQEDSTGTFGTGEFPVSFTGLSANTRYNARVYASNPSGTGYSLRDAFWTLANVPETPTLNNVTATTLDITIDANGNPDSTLFAIQDSINGTYVQADGSLAATTVWKTATAWGTKTITGLTAGNTYYFRVTAKHGGGTETAFGISASGMPMAAPTVDYPTVGGSWTETQPNGDSNYYWYTVSTSFDGSKMLAGQQNGRLYLSINGGSSWSETQPVGSGDAAWISSAVSSDGNTLVATVDNGRMYKSTSNGTSWSEIGPTPLSDKYWTSVSISSDGSKMLAGVTNYGKLYSSGNGGVTWNEGNIVQHWSSVSISSDGNKMIAAAHFGRIYLSVNGGADWSEIGPVPYEAKDWQAVSISGDGNTMLAAVYDGRLYKSTDGGVTWAETMPAGPNNRNWDYVSISEDGAKMLAGISWGRLYISTDYGATWSETGPAPFINRPWESLAVSGNGIKMIACENGQRIYTRIPFTITNISPTSATGNGSIASLNGGGDATTRGCIYYSYTGTNKIIGDTDVTNVSTNGIFSTGDFTASLTGLSVNNRYNLRAHATNTVGTGYSARCDFWTLANVPGTPTLNNPTATTLDITIDANGNPDSTLFAIQDSINSTYVQADGSLAATTVWKTATAWGTKTITGLTTGTAYYFRVKAKNGEGVETAFGDTASAIPTSKPALAWKVVETVWDSTASEKRWWMDVDVAANGQDMLACVIFGRLFHSADRGATWTEIQPDGDKDKKWNKVAMSGDGQIMLAGEQNGRLYQSSDGGNSWTEQQPAGNTNQDWGLLSISSDGNTILAGSGGLRLYLSTNAGQAWNEIQPGGDSDYHWYSAAVSEDGQILLAAVKNGRIYRSFDQGSTWAEVQPIDNDDHNWKAVSVSGNGQYMMAGEFTGRIYQSGDYGNKWTETQPLGDNDAYWETLSMSFDGQARYSTYSDPDGALFESPDRGENWTRLFDNLEWTVAAVSSDASTVLAGSFLDRLYCGRTVIFDSITTTTALGTATIASTNGGNVTNRGAFYYLYSDTGKQIGDASVVNTDTTGTFPAGEYPVTFTGLSVNTHYNARAHATNYKGTGYSYRTGFWTLANVPSAPTVDNPTATTLDVAVNVNGNPNATEFVIHETSTDKFIQADGTLGATAVWATATTWGTKTVTGLTTGTEYTFEVKARNGANVETDYGTSTSQSTCSNPTNGGSIGSDQTICSGSTPVAFTSNSSPSNYAGTLEYKWQVSTTSELTGFTDISASNSLTYSPGALTMDSWYKRLARVSCKTDWTGAAETNVVKITIRPTFTAGTILTTGETICYIGDPAEIGSTTAASGGDGNIEYKWQADGSDIAGSNSATYNPPSGLTTTTVYTRWAKDGTCNAFEESTGSWTVTVDPTSVGGSVTGGTTICSGNTSALLTLSGHTGNVIKWQYSLDGITWTDIVHTGTTYTSGILTDTTQFRAVVLSGVCIEAYSTPTTVVVQYPVAVASVDIWCTGSPIGAIAYHAFPHNGGTPSYQWYKNGSPVGTNSPDYTNQAVAGDTVYVIMQSSLTCVAPVQSEGKCTVAH
jgi:photosystem II stability/assembly factor-like uncharacterized protein